MCWDGWSEKICVWQLINACCTIPPPSSVERRIPGGVVKHDPERLPQNEVDAGIAIGDTSHETMGLFLGEVFRASQLRRAIMEKEEFTIVRTFHHLKYLLRGGVRAYTDNQNVACVIHLGACVSSLFKAATQQRSENEVENGTVPPQLRGSSYEHQVARSCARMANALELAELDDAEGPMVRVGWNGFNMDGHTLEPTDNVWHDFTWSPSFV